MLQRMAIKIPSKEVGICYLDSSQFRGVTVISLGVQIWKAVAGIVLKSCPPFQIRRERNSKLPLRTLRVRGETAERLIWVGRRMRGNSEAALQLREHFAPELEEELKWVSGLAQGRRQCVQTDERMPCGLPLSNAVCASHGSGTPPVTPCHTFLFQPQGRDRQGTQIKGMQLKIESEWQPSVNRWGRKEFSSLYLWSIYLVGSHSF